MKKQKSRKPQRRHGLSTRYWQISVRIFDLATGHIYGSSEGVTVTDDEGRSVEVKGFTRTTVCSGELPEEDFTDLRSLLQLCRRLGIEIWSYASHAEGELILWAVDEEDATYHEVATDLYALVEARCPRLPHIKEKRSMTVMRSLFAVPAPPADDAGGGKAAHDASYDTYTQCGYLIAQVTEWRRRDASEGAQPQAGATKRRRRR